MRYKTDNCFRFSLSQLFFYQFSFLFCRTKMKTFFRVARKIKGRKFTEICIWTSQLECHWIWCDFPLSRCHLLTFWYSLNHGLVAKSRNFIFVEIFRQQTPTLYVFDLWFSKNGYEKKEGKFSTQTHTHGVAASKKDQHTWSTLLLFSIYHHFADETLLHFTIPTKFWAIIFHLQKRANSFPTNAINRQDEEKSLWKLN